jgi:outer membrane protein assembly factor BamB
MRVSISIHFSKGARCAAALIAALSCAAGAAHAQKIDWTTFGGSAQRTSYNGAETILSPATVPGLTLLWKAKLSSAIKVQPALVRRISTPSGVHDLLVVTQLGGGVTALDAMTGASVWSDSLGTTVLPCFEAPLTVGVGEPATLDVARKRAYVVDAGGKLHALSLADGTEASGYPVEVIDSANLAASTWVHYASPTLIRSTLYIGTTSSCESAKVPYHGQLIRFSLGTGKVVGRYFPMGDGAVLGGGFWGSGGVAAEADGSFLWGATANALPAPQDTGNAEKIVQLDPDMKLMAMDGPVLAPGGDLDFGSTPLLFQPTGCPPMLAAMNKTGQLVMYNRTSLKSGPMQILSISNGGSGGRFIGMPSFDPVTNAVYVGNPLDSASGIYLHGLVALQADASCQLSLMWQQTVGENGNDSPSVTPDVANGVVYFSEGAAATMAAFDAASGKMLWQSGRLGGPAVAAPFVANGTLFVAAGDTVYAFGL